MMKRTSQVGPLAAGAAVWLMLWTSPAAASLAPSEAEQVRHEVATAQNVGHVRALVARPDLTSSEAAEAMAAAMSSTPVDPPHAAFLHELVFGSASAASRPMLAVAVVHGLLARADSLLGQHQTDLDRAASAVAELERAYALVEDVAIADAQSNVTDSAREECARALRDHVARNAVLRPDTTVSPAVAAVRAQAAIALLDASADTPSRRVDVANALALTAARRAALVELGVLVLDTGGSEARVSAVRALLDHLGIASASGDVVEAVVLGDERASRVRARAGAIVAVAAPSSATSADAAPWGAEAPPPPVDAATMAAARGLAAAAVRRALERRPALRAVVERDGGEAGVATTAAMLSVDAPRTFDAAAARMVVGKHENAAWLADALGALAVFGAPAKGADGLTLLLGRADDSGSVGATRATRVVLDAAGSASTLRVDGHVWRIARDEHGVVSSLSRDSAPVSAKSLAGARPPVSEGSSWSGAGLVFARLSGSPRVALASGPHVWLFGSTVADAVASPSPGDDVVLETDLRVQGGPGGVAVRALPGSMGAFGAFKGVSLLVVPGAPARAALLVSNGWGIETAAAPVVDLPAGSVQHVRVSVKRMKVEAKIGAATLEAALPEGFEHGDLALRAYSGATVEASGWKLRRP